MSSLKADTGNGASITLSVSALSLAIKDIDISAIELASLSCGVLATTDFDEVAPSDLKKPPKITVMFLSNGAVAEPTLGQLSGVTRASGEAYKGETVTVTYPVIGGSGTAGKFVGTGYIESWKPSKFVNGAWQEGTIVIQYDGVTGPAYTAQT
jgi:hypothetical protein